MYITDETLNPPIRTFSESTMVISVQAPLRLPTDRFKGVMSSILVPEKLSSWNNGTGSYKHTNIVTRHYLYPCARAETSG